MYINKLCKSGDHLPLKVMPVGFPETSGLH